MMAQTLALSACGAFARRRCTKINSQARKATALVLPEPVATACEEESARLSGAVELTVAEQLLHRNAALEIPPAELTERKNYSSTKNSEYLRKLQMHFQATMSSVCANWLLVALLLAVVLSNTTQQVAAAPRRLSGAHLVLPHRYIVHHTQHPQHHHLHLHHHHVQHRSVANQTGEAMNCTVTQKDLDMLVLLEEGKNSSQDTREEMEYLLNNWTMRNYRQSLVNMSIKYSLVKLGVEHPLNNDTDLADFKNVSVGPLSSELAKILETLTIIHKVLSKYKGNDYNNTFWMFHEKIEKNMHVFRNFENVFLNSPHPIYDTSSNDLLYTILAEALNIVTVLNKKYEKLLIAEKDRLEKCKKMHLPHQE